MINFVDMTRENNGVLQNERSFLGGRLVPKNFHLPFKHMYEALNVIK